MTIRSHEFFETRPGFTAEARARAGRLVQKIAALAVAWSNRRAAGRMLMSMDERMLADIGVTRSDLRSAWSEPLWRDPTLRLRRIAVERRAAFQAVARERLQRPAQRPDDPRPPVSRVDLRRPRRTTASGLPLVGCGEAA